MYNWWTHIATHFSKLAPSSLCVCVCIHIYIYTYIYTYRCIYKYIHIYTQIQIHTYMYTHICIYCFDMMCCGTGARGAGIDYPRPLMPWHDLPKKTTSCQRRPPMECCSVSQCVAVPWQVCSSALSRLAWQAKRDNLKISIDLQERTSWFG